MSHGQKRSMSAWRGEAGRDLFSHDVRQCDFDRSAGDSEDGTDAMNSIEGVKLTGESAWVYDPDAWNTAREQVLCLLPVAAHGGLPAVSRLIVEGEEVGVDGANLCHGLSFAF